MSDYLIDNAIDQIVSSGPVSPLQLHKDVGVMLNMDYQDDIHWRILQRLDSANLVLDDDLKVVAGDW